MDSQEITISQGEWSEEASGYIARALVHATPEEVKAQVQAGAALFYVRLGETLIGCYVSRIDRSSERVEGVIVAAGGDYCGIDLIAALLPEMEKQFIGVHGIRIHTSRPGMGKALTKAGYRAKEIVFEKVLT